MGLIARRSADAVINYLIPMGYEPQSLTIAGIGVSSEEAKAFKEWKSNIEIAGFEPHPDTVAGLVKSQFPGQIIQAALVGDTSTKYRQLHCNSSWKNGSSLYQPREIEDSKWFTVEVPVYRLDDAKPHMNISKRGILWLDCEGSEAEVLRGGKTFINEFVDVVNVEMTGNPRGNGWCNPKEVHSLLLSYGFLQVWVHTIRPVIGQFDAVYMRRRLIDPRFCCNPDTLIRHDFTTNSTFQ